MNETFQEYSARLLSLVGSQDPFTVLESTPRRIASLIAGRTAEELRWTPEAGRWSITQIVAHIADAEIVGAYRFRLVLASPGTPIQAYDQDAWSRSQRSEGSDAHESLALFTAVRAAKDPTPNEIDPVSAVSIEIASMGRLN